MFKGLVKLDVISKKIIKNAPINSMNYLPN